MSLMTLNPWAHAPRANPPRCTTVQSCSVLQLSSASLRSPAILRSTPTTLPSGTEHVFNMNHNFLAQFGVSEILQFNRDSRRTAILSAL